MENQFKVWETIHYSDTQFEIGITIELLKNNIGQLLTNLINNYKFYYSSLNISEYDFNNFKHVIELNLVLSDKYDFEKLKLNAKNLLSLNYIKDSVEVIFYELIEICQIIYLLEQRNKGYSKTVVDYILNKYFLKLKKETLPSLLSKVSKAVDGLDFEKHIISINSVRNCLVHKNGYVDKDLLNLITYVPKLITDNSFTKKNFVLNSEELIFVDYIREWKINDKITLEYEDCFRIQMTIILFFDEIVKKLIIKFPFLKNNK